MFHVKCGPFLTSKKNSLSSKKRDSRASYAAQLVESWKFTGLGFNPKHSI